MQIIDENNQKAAKIAAQFILEGKIIAFPTDTVYGIACDAANSNAVAQLYKIKKRDLKKPIAIFVKDIATAKKIFIFDELAEETLKTFAKKPLTLVLKTRDYNDSDDKIKLANNLNNDENNNLKNKFLGFRIVNRKFITNLLEEFGGTLAVSSANPSGQESAISADDVKKYFPKLDLLVDGGFSQQKTASTVIKIANQKIEILRQDL